MVNRKPLVLNSGVISELVSADSIDVTSNLPAIAPSAIFDFKNGLSLDSRIQLSRNSGVGTRFNKLGGLETVPANVPRFDYANGVSKGVLIEQAASNICLQSNVLTNGTWAKLGATAPNNYTLLEDVATNTFRYFRQSITVTSGTTYCFSALVSQRNAGKGLFLGIADIPFPTDRTVRANLTAKTVTTSGTVVASGLIQVDTNLFIVYVAVTAESTGSARIYVETLKESTNSNVFTSDGAEGIYIYNTQLEVGNYPTSMIATTTTAVTRTDELAIIPQTNIDFINLTEFSAVVEFTAQSVGTSTVISFHDATANNRIFIQSIAGVTTLKVITAGVEQCNLALGTLVTGTDYKIAFRVKTNDVAASINGAPSLTDTSVTIPTVTTINLGSDYANTNILNSTFAKVIFYAAALTNTNLEALSL